MTMILTRYLDPEAIRIGSEAKTVTEVVGLLADTLEASGHVAPTWRGAVLQRESQMPTGLPLSSDLAVAVPHTDPHHVLKAGLAVATLKTPVDFRSMEDPDEILPVRLVFALALTHKDEQIEMLQTVAGLLQDPERVRRLASATTLEAITRELSGINPDAP